MNNNIKQNGNDFIVDRNQYTEKLIIQPLEKTFNYVDNRSERIIILENIILQLNDEINKLRTYSNNQEILIQNLNKEIIELKNQTTKTEIEIYNNAWLRNIILEFNKSYYYTNNGLIDVCTEDKINRQHATLDPKTSAIIIFHALAKKLNGDKQGTQAIYLDTEDNEITWITTNTDYNYVNPLFVSAKNAIDILNQINPIIIKNYFN